MSDSTSIESVANAWLASWLAEIPAKSRTVAGTFSGVIVILDTLLTNFDLENPGLFTEEGARVARQSAKTVQTIANRYDAGIRINSIGGRTNPGPAAAAKKLLRRLQPLNLQNYPEAHRIQFLEYCIKFCVARLRDVQNQKKFEFTFAPPESLQVAIGRLIGDPKKNADQLSALAQHLVGAKLEVRFGENFKAIRSNRSSYAANDASKPGDFEYGDYVFHVSISPTSDHISKCIRNLEARKRPLMIVPAARVNDVIVLARDRGKAECIGVRDIESFVSQNIEEEGKFSAPLVEAKVQQLLEIYNDRVKESEQGRPYLLIESPLLPSEEETTDVA